MQLSRTLRISTILSAVAVAVVVGVVACPGRRSSDRPAPTLLSIALTPANPTIALGTSQQLTATGTWSDGLVSDVTDAAEWSSSDSGACAVSTALESRGLATGVGMGSATITASFSGRSGSTTLAVSDAALVSIEVTPTNPSIALGTSSQFVATGIFTDGTAQDLTEQVSWEISAPGTATISNAAGSRGLAQSAGLGDTTITATHSGVSGATTLTVTSAVLVSIGVAPTNPGIALGTRQPFTATGTFSDGSVQDLTNEVVWSSSADAALVSNDAGSQGLAHGVAVGSATISAAYAGLAGSTTLTVTAAELVSIAVTPAAPAIPLGRAQTFVATGTFTDGSVQDLTAAAKWSSSDASVAAVSNAAGERGRASSFAVGATAISAELAGVSGSTTLTVSSAALVAIDVTPSHAAAALGTTLAFTATGTYTDGTTQELTTAVTWSTSAPEFATVSNAGGSHGLATTVAVGTVTITAALGGVSGSTSFTVSPAEVVEIAVSPDAASLARGTALAFSALAVFTDGTLQILTEQVTWSSSDDSVAAVSNAAASRGLVTAVAMGSVTLTAAFEGVSGSAAVEVTAAALESIDVAPVAPSIAQGTQLQFSAQGNYTDGSTQDLTSEVTWSSSNTGVATISNAAGSRGLASGASMGSTTILAALATVGASVELEVTAAALDSIDVTPENPSVPAGASHGFRALGRFSDGGTQDITDLVTWSSSDPTVATISNAAESKGLVQCLRGGTAQIGATLAGRTRTTTLTVSAATLASISVSPAPASVPDGFSIALRAVGAYTDGSTRDLTEEVVWTSSDASVARVSNAQGSRGRAKGRAPGTVTISAMHAERSASTLLTVTGETLSSIVVEPASVALPVGGTQQMVAWGHFSGGSVVDVTREAQWRMKPGSIASIGNAPTNKGLVTALRSGDATIRASLGNRLASAPLTVSGP